MKRWLMAERRQRIGARHLARRAFRHGDDSRRTESIVTTLPAFTAKRTT